MTDERKAMFEKEAEENGFGIGCTVSPTIAWQNGAEYGYNKAKEEYEKKLTEITENRDELLSQIDKLEERIGELEECY